MSVFTELLATTDHPAQGTAGTDETFDVGEMPFDGTLTEAGIIPAASQAGVDTTTRTFTLQNRGNAGTGTTVMATFVTDVAGGGFTAHDKKLMTLSATPANLQFAAGDVLAVVETHGSTGAAHPAMTVQLRGTHR